MRSAPQRLSAAAVLLVAFLVAAALENRFLGAGLVDDAYIFARFAQHLATGHGFRFNPEREVVEGFTSPFWVVLLALAARLGVEPPVAATFLGVASGALLVALVAAAAPEESRRPLRSGLAALPLAVSPTLLYWSASGMDMVAFGAVTAALCGLLSRPRPSPVALGVVVGIGTWVRPEAALVWLPGVLVAQVVLLGRRDPVRTLLETAAASAPFLVAQLWWRHHTFGMWLPNTFEAKVAASFALRLRHGLAYLRENALTHLGWMFLAVACAIHAVRTRDRHLAVLVGGAILWLAYVVAVGADHFALGRFLLPAIVVVSAAAVRGAAGLSETDRGRMVVAASVGVVAMLWLGALSSEELPRARLETGLARAWLKVGFWLRRHEPPGTRLATIAAGAIPYASGFETFDMLGLVTPEVAHAGYVYAGARPGHQRYDNDDLLRFQPDIIIYPTSGRFATPQWRDPSTISTHYAYALRAAVMDPRVQALYEYEASRLEDGTWVEMLRRRGGERRGGLSAAPDS